MVEDTCNAAEGTTSGLASCGWSVAQACGSLYVMSNGGRY